jgi:hypothetical protein
MPRPYPIMAGIIAGFALLAGCSKSEQQQTGNELRSDMQLHDTAYYVANEAVRVDMQGVCDKWKASQRSPFSWPSVVVETCNNVASANEAIHRKKDRDDFKKGMGI